MKRAFTLIELLVVIAIIAILAAILFPVFAQAKAAAKAAASLSNAKQNGLGAIMYSGDSDDVAMMPGTYNPGGAFLNFGAFTYNPWTFNIQPYLKNSDLFVDPLAPPVKQVFANNPNANRIAFPHYGYNYCAFAPITTAGGLKTNPISMTSMADPAGTVMLSSRTSNAEISDGTFYYFGLETPFEFYSVFPPVFGPLYKRLDWGRGGDTDAPYTSGGVPAGAVTGHNSFRASNNNVQLWGDGHAAKKPIGALAAGTNFQNVATWSHATTAITDRTKYLWDVE